MLKGLSKKTKIIVLYCLSFICIYSYYYIDESLDIKKFLIQADNNGVDDGFYFGFIYFSVKYVLLIFGIAIAATVSFDIFKD